MKTFSETRATYKPSSLLADITMNSRKVSREQFRVLYEKPTQARKTRKKVCGNPTVYFRTLATEHDGPALESFLCTELFGKPIVDDHEEVVPTEEESMELVNLKNSSLHVSKVFGSNLLERSSCKSDKESDTTLAHNTEVRPPGDTSHILSLVEKLHDAIKVTSLDSRTRLKLQESVAAMRKTLASRDVQLSRSFTKYLCNARPTLLYRN